MGEEIDRMMLLKRLTIIFLVVFCVILAGIIGLLIFMDSGDYGGGNSDFAELEAYDQIEKREYKVDPCNTLLFFSEAKNNERTLFLDEIPNVKIVNSYKFTVEISASKSLLDKLSIGVEEEMLSIGFDSKYYSVVETGDRTYKGLYVDCAVFDVTVYAPISVFHSNAEINLEFDAPRTDVLKIIVGGEIREGKVYNINSEYLLCSLSGASTVTLSGKVSKASQLEVMHNSKIDAEGLTTKEATTGASSQLFGFSYIVGEDYSDYSFGSMGFLLTIGIILLLLVACGLCVMFFVKYRKQKKELDLSIEKIEAEGKFLLNPEKTDEKLLQNN